jgi:hypothetical protein
MVIVKLLLVRNWAAVYRIPGEIEIERANSLTLAKFGEQVTPGTVIGFSAGFTQRILYPMRDEKSRPLMVAWICTSIKKWQNLSHTLAARRKR